MHRRHHRQIAVIGSGAAGLSAAWLLSRTHAVTLIEKDDRLGGHAHTAIVKQATDSPPLAVDTGFIVYNEQNYPNLTAWLAELGVASQPTDMSFAVSRNYGQFEYKGGRLHELFAQRTNLLRPAFWGMLRDLVRFYREASNRPLPAPEVSLGDYLGAGRYGRNFIDDHLLPFGAAVWSTSQQNMLDYPAAAFIQFCDNHGLLNLSERPQWRTIVGGSDAYVKAVRATLGPQAVLTSRQITAVRRDRGGVLIEDREGHCMRFDAVVLATHADQTLDLLIDADEHEAALLNPFRYDRNLAILHTDTGLMPRRRRAWASWNYMDMGEVSGQTKTSVSYWMNNLQRLDSATDYFVSLNPARSPTTESILRTSVYEHPMFSTETFAAQQCLWTLQGRRNTWFCGSYFGAGFHEDAIQSGLAAAEDLGRVRRPWDVPNESGRIVILPERIPVNDMQVA